MIGLFGVNLPYSIVPPYLTILAWASEGGKPLGVTSVYLHLQTDFFRILLLLQTFIALTVASQVVFNSSNINYCYFLLLSVCLTKDLAV